MIQADWQRVRALFLHQIADLSGVVRIDAKATRWCGGPANLVRHPRASHPDRVLYRLTLRTPAES